METLVGGLETGFIKRKKALGGDDRLAESRAEVENDILEGY